MNEHHHAPHAGHAAAASGPEERPHESHDHHSHHDSGHQPDGGAGHAGHGGDGAHEDHAGHHAAMIADFRRRFWVSIVLTVPILLLSPMLQEWVGFGTSLRFAGDQWVLFGLSAIVYLYGGWPFLSGMAAELRAGRPGMMTLVAMAITVAMVYSSAVVFGLPGMSFFWETATLIDLMLLGHWIEMRSIMGASRALEELARLMPSEAHLLAEDGSVRDVPIADLSSGDRVVVKPGEKIPADGAVVEGRSAVNEAMLTGESTPVAKKEGDEVIGGSVNGEGSITVEVGRTGEESFLAQVIALVRQAQESRSRTQDLANRAALWLTIVAIGGGIITLLVWWLVMGESFAFAIERAVTVMVISCPHALGLAVPLVVAVSTSLAARKGLLIRDRAAFESARNIEAVVFDKTGTLTEGSFGVVETVLVDGSRTKEELLRLAAAVEARSQHPIALGITGAVEEYPTVSDFHSMPGEGARGSVDGHDIAVVSPGYLRARGIEPASPRISELEGEGRTVVHVLIDGKHAGAIALGDMVRVESADAIDRLHEMGIRTFMLTGDNRRVAEAVGKEIGIDEVKGEVLPDQKASEIRAIRERGLRVAMTGDGVNDAPALAEADVGIAVGAGTDVAIETADVILVRSNPQDVVAVVELARETYRKMKQNLWWAAGYNIVAIPLAAGVLAGVGIVLSPAIGAVLMSLSTVIVAVNARKMKA